MKIINFISLSYDGHGLIVVVLSLLKNKLSCNESHLGTVLSLNNKKVKIFVFTTKIVLLVLFLLEKCTLIAYRIYINYFHQYCYIFRHYYSIVIPFAIIIANMFVKQNTGPV